MLLVNIESIPGRQIEALGIAKGSIVTSPRISARTLWPV